MLTNPNSTAHLNIVRVHSFVGPSCTGNPHSVVQSAQILSNAQGEELSRQLAPDIVVLLDDSSNSVPKCDLNREHCLIENIRHVRFFQYGRMIHWCGSGLLAAAHVCQRQGYMPQALQCTAGTFSLTFRDGRWGFGCNISIRWRPAQHPHQWHHLRSSKQRIINQLQSADARGYILLELDSQSAVARWQSPCKHLQRHHSRTLIVTARASARSPFDYVMRYFAPQYGNNEDRATGSANAILMVYWHRILHKQWLQGKQLSNAGGVFYGTVKGRKLVTLFGTTEEVTG